MEQESASSLCIVMLLIANFNKLEPYAKKEFPIISAFTITINKSQKQRFEKIGILLSRPVFTHGQLYVAASRIRSFNGLRFYIFEYNCQGHLANDERIFAKNIVYTEVLNH
jgi:ATP-dependent exoDNAse (exonuclease V) alpha subunit